MDLHATSAQALLLYKGKIFSRDNVSGEGFPLDPQPFLVRACYISSEEQLQQSWPTILTTLKDLMPKQMLQLLLSPDGPPYRAARLFYFGGQDRITANKGKSDLTVDVFYPVGDTGQPWDIDTQRLKPGLFITGEGGPTNIWRIHRIERDAWRGPLFTLAPLLLASGFPMLDLSGVHNADRRKEIVSHYDELQRCVITHSYRGAIARAKDIAEALITEKSGKPQSDPFHAKLEDIFAQLRVGKPLLSWLTFTLCQKLRLVYKRTHPENALEEGRPVSPELALSVVHDLIEILNDLGHVKDTSVIGST
jgi:hypothetical protein